MAERVTVHRDLSAATPAAFKVTRVCIVCFTSQHQISDTKSQISRGHPETLACACNHAFRIAIQLDAFRIRSAVRNHVTRRIDSTQMTTDDRSHITDVRSQSAAPLVHAQLIAAGLRTLFNPCAPIGKQLLDKRGVGFFGGGLQDL